MYAESRAISIEAGGEQEAGHYSNKFSLEANKKHYQKKVKGKKADGAKEEDPFKSSGAASDKPSGKSKPQRSEKNGFSAKAS